MADAVLCTLRPGREGAQIGENAPRSRQNELRRCALTKLDEYISRPELAHRESDYELYRPDETQAEYENYIGIPDSEEKEDRPEEIDGQSDCREIVNVPEKLSLNEGDRRAVQLTD